MNNLVKALIAVAVIGGISIIVLSGGDKPQNDPSPNSGNNIEENGPEPTQPKNPIIPPAPEVRVGVSGTVADELGNGLPGATVRVEKVTGSASEPKYNRVQQVFSDSSGTFEANELLPARYRFVANLDGFAENSVTIVVTEGDIDPIKIVLTSGLAIEGYVRDAAGAPIAGAVIGAFQERAKQGASLEERLQILTQWDEIKNEPGVYGTSDENGRYKVQGLQAMKYRLNLIAAGFAPSEKRYVEAGSSDVNFNLERGGQLSGRVMDESGSGIANADVQIFIDSGTQDILEIIQERALPPLDTRVTDGSGSFLFDTLGGDAGYRLVARASGYQTEDVAKVIVAFGEQANLDVTLRAGNQIHGIVYDPFGSPLEGARCRVNPVGVQPQGPPTDFDDGIIESDANGEFVFDTLGDSNYRLVVSHDEYATYVQPRMTTSDQSVSVHLTEGCAISGGIYEEETGTPIAGAMVSIHDTGGEQKWGLTDAGGQFFVRGISETRRGVVHLNVEKEGYERVSNQKIEVAEGTVTEGVDHFLKRNGLVRGTVVDANGTPVAGVAISARRSHPNNAVVVNVGKMTTSGPDGSFVVDQVQTGVGTFLEGTHGDYLKSQSEMFDVAPGQDVVGLQLVMRLGGALSGRVVDENGVAIFEAIVGAKDDVMSVVNPQSLTNKVYTDSNGEFTLRRLEAGEQALLIAAKGYLTLEITGYEVEEGRTTTNVEVRMTAGAYVTGLVRNELSEPIVGARVTAIDTSDGLRKLTSTTDSNGEFRFEELGRFPIDIEAEAMGYGKVRITEQPVNSDNVEFVLEAFGSVCGQVFTENGEALRAFSVSPKMVDTTGRARPRHPSRTFQSQDGTYCFEGLDPGTYEVVIGAPGFAPEIVEGVIVGSNRVTDVPAVSLGMGGRIAGLVYDATTGTPVPGATVTVVGGARHFLDDATTGPSSRRNRRDQVAVLEDGSFEIIGLKSGRVTLKIEHRSYMTEIVQDVTSGTTDLEIPLSAGGSIEGVVTGDGGKIQPGMQILISSPQPGGDRRVVTDRRGRYSVSGLPSGLYTLRISNFGRPGGRSDLDGDTPTYEVEVFAGEITEANLQM